MSRLSCRRALRLVDARKIGLTEPDGLWLEEHLAGCTSCHRDAADLDRIRALVDDTPPLSERSRARAIQAALRAQPIERQSLSRRPSWRTAALGATAIAAAAAVVFVWLSPMNGRSPLPPTASQGSVGRVVDGEVIVDGDALSPGAMLPEHRTIQTKGTAQLSVAHARVALAGAARWQHADHTLWLDAGRARVDVDPAPRKPFRVRTSRFVVVVLGTRFVVDQEGIQVTEGAVRVESPSGQTMTQRLGAGESWKVDSHPRADVPVAEVTARPVERDVPAAQPAPRASTTPRASDRPHRSSATRERPKARRLSVDDLLARSRQALATRSVGAAQTLIDQALAASPSRVQAAEAHTLLAECALVQGQRDKAISLYRRVADRFAGLPAAESALFAAARHAAAAGRSRLARQLLNQYTTRHPEGRFRKEVDGHLERLRTSRP